MADAKEALDDINWTIDLESALIDGCDFGTLRNICKGRPVPEHLRAEIWQICLNVADKGDQLAAFDELYDMPEQNTLREDCQALVEKLGNDDEEKLSVASDLESILTYYCKCRGETYARHNGWLDILQPMIALKCSKSDLYNCVYAFLTKYIPRGCRKNGTPFHLFRLLLLYHDPELCTFMDSRKITPDLYLGSWFRSMFAAICHLDVIMAMWDVYLQQTDQFLVFFLSLVMLINAKEQILSMKDSSRQDIIDCLEAFPTALQAEDVQDFCSLAQYYGSQTSQSFRRVYHEALFGTATTAGDIQDSEMSVAHALCLPVSVTELLQANTDDSGEAVRYFVVDCRPAEQYNAGHLPIAFHLDANLMLQNPTEFANAVQALSMAQKQAIASGSVAGGEHLCFMGSGRDEEDQYVNMVVANFLQRNCLFVSLASGGYAALHEALGTELRGGLTDHNARCCIVCHPDALTSNGMDSHDEYQVMDNGDGQSLIDRFGKLSSVMKSKSVSMKEKMINYIKNEPSNGAVDRHVSSTDRMGKRYRNMESVFTIGDDDGDDVSDEVNDTSMLGDERRDIVNIDTWKKKADVTYSCQCQEVRQSGYTYASHLIVTETHLYVLREIPEHPHTAWLQVRRALGSVVKITSKKKHPELITFKYGTSSSDAGIVVTDLDRFIISRAGEATKAIKTQIMKVLDQLET